MLKVGCARLAGCCVTKHHLTHASDAGEFAAEMFSGDR